MFASNKTLDFYVWFRKEKKKFVRFFEMDERKKKNIFRKNCVHEKKKTIIGLRSIYKAN